MPNHGVGGSIPESPAVYWPRRSHGYVTTSAKRSVASSNTTSRPSQNGPTAVGNGIQMKIEGSLMLTIVMYLDASAIE